MLDCFSCAETYLDLHRQKTGQGPIDPVRVVRPFAITRAVNWFQTNFAGQLIYALKANPSPFVISALQRANINRFDVASLKEIELVLDQVPEADLYYMNPVKSRAHIREAYFKHGVRRFAVDDKDEVEKILMVTQEAKDLTLFVRLHCNDQGSVLPLGQKYGAEGEAAKELLQMVRAHAAKLGVTFHVGSQALVPQRYSQAMEQVAQLVCQAGVTADILNVGGGFPSRYQESDRGDLSPYTQLINSALKDMPLVSDAEVYAEPGRALVAEAESLIVRVDARRGSELFINDGGYGILFDGAHSNWVFPARLVGIDTNADELIPFCLWGPTCDAADRLEGPFYFPDSVQEGDYLEIYKTGAYGWSMSSRFNGFGTYEMIELEDEGMHSNYLPEASVPQELKIS